MTAYLLDENVIRELGSRGNANVRKWITRVDDVDLSAALFAAHYGPPGLTGETIDAFVGATLDEALAVLTEQTRRSLPFSSAEERGEAAVAQEGEAVIGAFANALPAIRGLLVSDIHAAYDNDPAATGLPEILLVYMTMNAREFLQTDVVVLGVIAYALLGKLADSLTRAIEHRALSWHPAYQGPGGNAV